MLKKLMMFGGCSHSRGSRRPDLRVRVDVMDPAEVACDPTLLSVNDRSMMIVIIHAV